MFSNTLIGLKDNLYLDEMYTFKAKDHQNWDYLTTVKETRTGLTNLGNSCWFNAVVQLYTNSKFMRNVNKNFNYQLSYEEKLRSVLEIFDRVGKGMEISKNYIQLALNDLHMLYGLHSSQQNDAHEFTATGIEHCMGLFGDACLIKIQESYVCTVCGKSLNREQQVYNDIQLAIPPDVLPHEGIRELLDRYFEGEEIDSCCCGDSKRWRQVTISEFPADLSICLIRHSIKNNRSVKNRKPITLNNLINLGKYTEPRRDILYTGVVIHHGSSPRFGHYTFLKYDGGIPIVINDDKFSVYHEAYHLTDSYLLQYERVPQDKDICHSHLPHLIALNGCEGWNLTIDAMTNASNISVRSRMILNHLEQKKIDESTVTHSWRAYRLIQEAIGPVDIFNGSNQFECLINSLLSYICSNNQSLMGDNFGLSTVERTTCLTCQHTTTNTVHKNCIDFQNLMPLKSIISNDELERCPVCKEESSVEIKHCILKYGRTVIIKGNSDILHSNGFSKLISKFTPKAVICSMFTFIFRQIGRDVEILQIETPNIVTEVSMETIQSVADQYMLDLIVIADKVDESETINNYQIIDETTFIEPDNNLNLHLQSCDVNFMDGFNAPLRVNGYKLECEDVSRFLCGQFSDINIDTFFSTLKLDNSLIIPSSWFASNIGIGKTNKTEGKDTWFDKDSIYLPINVNRNHWILTVIFPKDTLIHHFDPLEINQPLKFSIPYATF
ncbi:unnamed protein product [Mytilus coruscus]|uniref:USP domain-containing protein n=1 Tax=Mytilus coruscus TaxID=42192 RepID=A0A6J8AWJ9_MYTCO|nr:unnamed protein product [Mytilus coruscus]